MSKRRRGKNKKEIKPPPLSRESQQETAVNHDGRPQYPSAVQPFALHSLRREEDSKAIESRRAKQGAFTQYSNSAF